MNYKTYNSTLQENEKPIYVLSKRVGFNTESLEQLVLSQNEMMNQLNRMSVKIDKVHDKVFEKPDYFSVEEIALKQGVNPKTVQRHIRKGNIPFERNEDEKAYKIPAEHYYQSLSSSGKSSWLQNHY